MKQLLYKIFSIFISRFYDGIIVGKVIKEANLKLFYEKSQHLTFFFQTTIEYERNIQKKLKNYIRKGDSIFDIGGNIGQYALLFSSLVDQSGETGRVITFEPDPKNYSFLHFNKNINFRKNITCLNLGLGDQKDELIFYCDTTTGGRRGSFRKQYVGTNYKGLETKVNVDTFDNMVNKYGMPDFVKIDVEGFEEMVLAGIKTIPEATTFLIEVRNDTRELIYNRFDNTKFECYWIDNEIDIKIFALSEIPPFANLLFVPIHKSNINK